MEIFIDQVTKAYATVTAVKQASFEVRRGEIVALLGPNGAGKSSLVRMLVGLTFPDTGSIKVTYNNQPYPHLPAGAFGYLPEDRGLYQDRTLKQNLTYIGQLRGMSKAEIDEQLDYWLERFSLVERADENLKQLSKGNQQKIQLIATLMHQPPMVILDEPFSGLDPVNQEIVLDVLSELKNRGVTVLLSAHQMALVERLADRMVLMNLGAVVAQGTLTNIQEQLLQEHRIRVDFAESVTPEQIKSVPGVERADVITPTTLDIIHSPDTAPSQLLAALLKIGAIQNFGRQVPDLHSLYLQAVGKQTVAEETSHVE